MPHLMRTALLPVLAAVLLGLAACGGGDDGGGGAASSAPCASDAVTIKMVDIKFEPQKAMASAGTKVCWVNEDSIQHDAVAESGADFKSDLFNKGQTFTATVDEPGTVKYVCTVHPGMTGEITVAAN
jgi:plastocyanin